MAFKLTWVKQPSAEEQELTQDEGYAVVRKEGFDWPAHDHIVVRGPRQDGATFIGAFFTPRDLALRIFVDGSSIADLESRLMNIARLFNPKDSGELKVLTAGGQTYTLVCRPQGAPGRRRLSPNHVLLRITLVADDPFFKGAEQNENYTTASQSGLTIPFTIPFVISSEGNAVDVAIINDGHVDAFPIVKVDGPATDPVLRSLTVDASLTINRVIASGASVTVDMGEKTAVLTNPDLTTVNVFADVSGDFWRLVSGANTVRMVNQGGSTMTGTIRYTERFLAVV